MTAAIVAAAYDYVATRDRHQDAGPLIDFGDQTCPACSLEHPGAECAQPSLLEEA